MQLMTKADVSTYLNVSKRTIEIWAKDESFPPRVQIGKSVWWEDDVVETWRDQQFKVQQEWKPRF